MTTVAASEHELIAMARALVAPHAHPPVFGRRPSLPAQISPACADVLGDVLRQVWPALWRRDRALPGAQPFARLRGWQRHAPAALTFTGATLQLVRWLVSTRFPTKYPPPLLASPLSLGDQVMTYLALDALGANAAVLAEQPLVRTSPLAWLGFAHLMTGEPPAFTELTTGTGAVVVEALTRELTQRWRSVETAKRSMQQPAALIALGTAQDATLRGFMAACEQRRDLAVFVIDAAAPVLASGAPPIPPLDPTSPLSARSAAREAAGALLRAVLRWRDWDDQHRAVRFIDDDFTRAQGYLARFEPIGRAGADRAAGWLAELASLAPTTPPPSDSIESREPRDPGSSL